MTPNPLLFCAMTGADDSTNLYQMLDLSAEFPFVEWGVLFSESRAGEGRYPTFDTIQNIGAMAEGRKHMNVALHVCGRAVEDLIHGKGFVCEVVPAFRRVQINFASSRFDIADIEAAICRLSDKTIITQHNEANADLWRLLPNASNHAVLFDASGGCGISPTGWPAPLPGKLCGYAGGLGPDNLSQELPLIFAAAGGAPFWIDMESKLRTNDKFDLAKVRQCLKTVAQAMGDRV